MVQASPLQGRVRLPLATSPLQAARRGTFAKSSNLVYTLEVTPTTPYTDVKATVA